VNLILLFKQKLLQYAGGYLSHWDEAIAPEPVRYA